MSDDRTSATGFARQFDKTAKNAGPPPRPKPATPPPAEAEASTPTPVATKPKPSKPEPLPTVADADYVPTGFQLSLDHIEAIQRYADQEGVFRQVAFEELIEQGIRRLGEEPTIPPARRRRGPGDYEYRRQLSVRVRADLLSQLDTLAEQNPKDGRSHVVRHLLLGGVAATDVP